jgi:ParB/RepB/Spo0J family partition protein
MPEYRMIAVSELADPPAPVRASIDESKIVELAESIAQVGILQPLIVVPLRHVPECTCETCCDDGSNTPLTQSRCFEVIAGHRRLLAARYLHEQTVPCLVYADAELAREAAMLHENIYREDLTAAEEGLFYAELIEKHDLTEDALVKMVRQKPAYIYDRLALVQGDPEVLRAVTERRISFAVAREINKCKEEKWRKYYLDMAERGGATAALVRQWASQQPTSTDAVVEAVTTGEPLTRAGEVPSSAMQCWLCGKDDAPYNLRMLWVCFYEVESIKSILRSAGVEVHEPKAAGA